MKANSMTEIIYDYFTSRIRFGYFKYGEQLPSIQNIRKQFEVNPRTVQAAFLQMKNNGYIETSERKPATVIFQPDEQSELDYIQYFLSHREGIHDICLSSDIILDPVIFQYFQRQDKTSLTRIRNRLEKADFCTFKPVIMFYAEAMRPLKNSLITNLHWEMVRYLRPPYLKRPLNLENENAQASEHIKRVLDFVEAGQFDRAAEEAGVFSKKVVKGFLEDLPPSIIKKEQMEQVPFQWHIYWEHPQLCYTLAAEIMSKIDRQIYKEGDFLPTCKALSLEYEVSFITARRTISLLNDMRVTETLNGIGPRVISGKSKTSPDFSKLQIRKCLILFLQALQICSLSCENVAVHTLSSLGSKDFQVFEQEIQTFIEEGSTYLTGEACLRFIGENSPSPFIREVYGQLYRLMLWGHSLHIVFKHSEVASFNDDMTKKLCKALHNHDIPGFSKSR